MATAERSKMEQSVLDLHTRDVETYQDEPLTWNTVVADSSIMIMQQQRMTERVKCRVSAEDCGCLHLT